MEDLREMYKSLLSHLFNELPKHAAEHLLLFVTTKPDNILSEDKVLAAIKNNTIGDLLMKTNKTAFNKGLEKIREMQSTEIVEHEEKGFIDPEDKELTIKGENEI